MRGQTSQFIGLSKQSISDQLKDWLFRTINFPITGFNWISNAPPLALIPCVPCLTAAMSRMNTHLKLIRTIIDELECTHFDFDTTSGKTGGKLLTGMKNYFDTAEFSSLASSTQTRSKYNKI